MRAADVPWPVVAERFRSGSGIAVLPFGALEQHGPHLPLSTDTLTAEAVAVRVAEALDGVLLPAVPYGDTFNSDGWPGTVSLSSDTVRAIVEDVARALPRSGATGLVVVNGDWGNQLPLHTAARRLAAAGGLPTVVLDHPGLDEAVARVRESRAAAPGLAHAEEVETSIVLALAPSLVADERPAPVYPDFPSDHSPSGVFGDPGPASADKGRELLDAVVDASLEVLRDYVARVRRPPHAV